MAIEAVKVTGVEVTTVTATTTTMMVPPPPHSCCRWMAPLWLKAHTSPFFYFELIQPPRWVPHHISILFLRAGIQCVNVSSVCVFVTDISLTSRRKSITHTHNRKMNLVVNDTFDTSVRKTTFFSDLFVDLFLQFANQTSSALILPRKIHTDPHLASLVSLIYQHAQQHRPVFFHPTTTTTTQPPPPPKNSTPSSSSSQNARFVLLGFTGGKDSCYMAIKLQSMGLIPILVYIRGINRCHPSEGDIVQSISHILRLDLIEIKVTMSGQMPFLSNPMKNGVILAILYDIGMSHGIHNFSLGTHRRTSVASTNLIATVSDGHEFIAQCNKFARRWIPNLQFHDIDVPIRTIYKTLFKTNLLQRIQSCISTHRYKDYLRQQNIKKYGLKAPLPNRCYSCYKCCIEHLVLTDLGMIQQRQRPSGSVVVVDNNDNNDITAHCIDIVRKKWDNIVLPNKPTNTKGLSDDDLYQLIINKY